MKPAQVNKLYAKLTPHEQATLVFEAAARLDENEIDTILAQVERKTYQSIHADYTRRINALQVLAANYGIEYWKTRALMLLSIDYLEDGYPQAEVPAIKFMSKGVALESALYEVCNELKVDLVSVKAMVGCLDNETMHRELPPVDTKLVKQYAHMLMGPFNSY